ncbi:hypothetical protein [Candidatus Lariskella endosymbiont of Hedychridium roseum]|uniref:hypothetical protein n=1 Tax=Candidatus Lariskella endosymbiont of Hedychridium roseum TaxID=3077949 RepID=UPI0030CF703F
MANIKTEFYAAIARLQKQLESNSLSKDDKAATEKYIKDTLSTFREKLSSSEKKMSVDDVKALAKEIDDADQKKEDLVNKINTPVKKEEIQDVATNLENLKKEFDDLNTQVSNAVQERPSKADYEKLKNDLSQAKSTYLDAALKDLDDELDRYIKDAKANKQDKISQDVSDKFKEDVKSKSDDCIGKLENVRSQVQDLLAKVKAVSDQIAPVRDLRNKFSDIEEKISIMLAKASDGKISEEDNNELSKVNNEFQAIVKDVTSLLKTTQDNAQQYPNLEELNTFTSAIVTDEFVKEKFDNLINKMNAPIVLVEKAEEASGEGEKEVKEQNDEDLEEREAEDNNNIENDKSLIKKSTKNEEEIETLEQSSNTAGTDNTKEPTEPASAAEPVVPEALQNSQREFTDLKTSVSDAISAKPSQDAYEKFKSDFSKIISTDCETAWQSLKSKAQELIRTAKDLQQDKISPDVRNKFVNDVKTKSNTCLEKFNETQPKGKKILGEMQQVSDQAAQLKALSDKLADIKTSDERAENQLQTLMHDVTNLLGNAKTAVQQNPNVDEAIQYLSKIPETKDIEKPFDNLMTQIDDVNFLAQTEENTQPNPFAEYMMH